MTSPSLCLRILVAPLLAVVVGGCASSSSHTARAPASPALSTPHDAAADRFPELRRLERAQLRRPDVQAIKAMRSASDAAVTRNVDSSATHTSLRSVIDAFAVRLAEVAPPLQPAEVDPDATAEALRLYIQGRARLLAGQPQQAMTDLRQAAQRDPAAAAPWRALGEASLLLGDRFGASTAFRQAVRRDHADLESLVRWGLLRKEAQDSQQAAILLSAAAAAPNLGERDPALPFIVQWGLGQALWDLGYARAAEEALLQAVHLPDTWRLPTRFGRELSQLARSRSDLWLRLAHARAAQGKTEGALQAALQAAAEPSVDPFEARQEAVRLALTLGRSALAARIALEAALHTEVGSDDRAVALVQMVAENSSLRPLLVRLLQARARRRDAPERAAQAARQLLASIMTSEEAVASLVQQLQADPVNDAVLWALGRRIVTLPPQRQAQIALPLVARAPWRAEAWARVLLTGEAPIQPLLDALRAAATDDASAALTLVAVLEALGRHDDADAALDDAVTSAPSSRLLLTAKAVRLARFGSWKAAVQILQGLTPPRDAVEAVHMGLAYLDAFRPHEAQGLLEPLADDDTQPTWLRVEALGALARSVSDQGDVDAAYAFLDKAWALAPAREDLAALAMRLAAPAGLQPNPQRLRSTLRKLRDANPGAALIRWLNIQDLVRSEQLEHAASLLQQLAAERFDDAAIAQLATVWSRLGAAEEGLDWVDEQVRKHPNVPSLKALKGLLLAEAGNVEQAQRWLQTTLTQHPQHPFVLRAMERLVRDQLRQPQQALDMALRRLRAQPLTFESLVERARTNRALSVPAEAIAALRRAAAWPARLTAAQRAMLVQETTALAKQALEQGSPPISEAVAIFAQVGDRLQELPPVAALAWAELIVRSETGDAQTLARAVLSATSAQRAEATQVHGAVLSLAIEAGKPELAAHVAPIVDRERGLKDPDVLALWAQAASMSRDLSSSLQALAAIEREGAALAIVSRLARVEHKPATEREAVAELAYQLAGTFYLTQQDAYAQLLEFALSRNPDHILANNDLGYLLADRGEQLDRALAMLERAYSLDPQRAAVVDSLAWARYKLGQLKDADGVEGAVTLLRKAIRLPQGGDDPILRDHLGDALWRVGRQQEAQAQWRVARSLAQARLAQGASPVDAQTLKTVERKLEAARLGQEPPLAPLAASKRNTTPNKDGPVGGAQPRLRPSGASAVAAVEM
ncbi:MAG: hypothetical protein D6824_00055 [Planctomycetota bacterium]|nr:MAG: hypothetical protein D6824_00055 [Planctomycetota bacterium]